MQTIKATSVNLEPVTGSGYTIVTTTLPKIEHSTQRDIRTPKTISPLEVVKELDQNQMKKNKER